MTASAKTEWNFEPCQARQVIVEVADTEQFPNYWARSFVGLDRKAVEVSQNGFTFYLDDEDGRGWEKVTAGGTPRLPHKNLVCTNVRDRV